MALTMIHLSSGSPRLAGLAKGLSLPAELAASGEVIVEVLAAELGATCDRANFVARGETAGGFRRMGVGMAFWWTIFWRLEWLS